MAAAEGARNVGLQLLADIDRVAPNAYGLMRQEAVEQENEYG
jgi:hypothetical protein